MSVLGSLHTSKVHDPRVAKLSVHIAELIAPKSTVLDVGCGDGLLSRILSDQRPDLAISGVDVLVRPETKIPVVPFDGHSIPFPDNSFDVVMFVDVLHHTDDPMVLLGTRAQADVPLVIGHNTAEGVFFARDAVTTVSAYQDFVRATVPAEFVQDVLRRYPATTDTDAGPAQLRFFADFRIVTPTTLTARLVSRARAVYMYQFARVSPLSPIKGAMHTGEVPYVFGLTADTSRFNDDDRRLSDAMAGAWVQFAKTGNPNGLRLPAWPAYRAPEYEVMTFGDEISIASQVASPVVDFFGRVLVTMRGK